jgi:hypothetical protein
VGMMGGALSSGSRMCVGWRLESVMGHTAFLSRALTDVEKPLAPRPLMAFVSSVFRLQSSPGTWLLTNTKPPYTLCMPGVSLSPRVRCR